MTATVTPMRSPEAPETAQEAFETWWKLYPRQRRDSKALCRSMWLQITSPEGFWTHNVIKDSGEKVRVHHQATPEQLVEAITRQEKLWRKPGIGEYGYLDDGKFIKLASTWLNRGAWED